MTVTIQNHSQPAPQRSQRESFVIKLQLDRHLSTAATSSTSNFPPNVKGSVKKVTETDRHMLQNKVFWPKVTFRVTPRTHSHMESLKFARVGVCGKGKILTRKYDECGGRVAAGGFPTDESRQSRQRKIVFSWKI